MENKKEHWLDYDHLFDDIRETAALTAAPASVSVVITDVEHFKVYESPVRPKWSSWARAWKMPDGALRVQFKHIDGGPPDLAPEYRWQFTNLQGSNSLGISRTFRTVESRDGGRSWSKPLPLEQGTETLSCEEPEVAELGNGDLLVVMRHCNPSKAGTDDVYVNCGQQVVRNVQGRWVAGPHVMTPLGFRGHPALLRTQEGIVICAGSGNQFNFSIDEGKTWSETIRIDDSAYRRHNHYPVLLEMPDGRIMSFYHMGNDLPYPPPEDEWIHATTFRVLKK